LATAEPYLPREDFTGDLESRCCPATVLANKSPWRHPNVAGFKGMKDTGIMHSWRLYPDFKEKPEMQGNV
jgi:hypothetical protein